MVKAKNLSKPPTLGELVAANILDTETAEIERQYAKMYYNNKAAEGRWKPDKHLETLDRKHLEWQRMYAVLDPMLRRLGDKLGHDLPRVHDKAAKDRVCGMVTPQEKEVIIQCIRHTDTDTDLMHRVDSGDYLGLMQIVNNRRGYSKQLAVKHRATRSRTVMQAVAEAAGASKPDSELRRIARRMGVEVPV